MARGDIKLFNATRFNALSKAAGSIDFFKTSGWKAAIVTDQYSTINANLASPRLADFTEVSAGGNYSAGGIALTTVAGAESDAESDGVIELILNTGTHTGGKITWAAHASNPATGKSLVVYDDDSTGQVEKVRIDWEGN